MKVAIIHFRSVRIPGGLESRLVNYARFFSDRGDELFIIHGKNYPDLPLPSQAKYLQVSVKWIPKPVRKLWFKHRCEKILETEKFDFILSLERIHGHALIAPGTHLGFLHAINRSVYRLSDFINIYLDRQAFGSSTIVFAASKMIQEELMNLYKVRNSKIQVLYPPSDPQQYNFKLRNNKNSLRKHFGMQDKFSFLFVSGSHNRKGLPLLLEIFKRLESFPVHLYVAGSPFKTQLPGNVTHLGFIQTMRELYTAADVLIHPAFYEPFGQIVSESLMCGTPVVISHKTGASELVNADEGIIVKSFNPESWLEAIKLCIEKEWIVPENFAERNGLTNEQHMEKMIATWNQNG